MRRLVTPRGATTSTMSHPSIECPEVCPCGAPVTVGTDEHGPRLAIAGRTDGAFSRERTPAGMLAAPLACPACGRQVRVTVTPTGAVVSLEDAPPVGASTPLGWRVRVGLAYLRWRGRFGAPRL